MHICGSQTGAIWAPTLIPGPLCDTRPCLETFFIVKTGGRGTESFSLASSQQKPGVSENMLRSSGGTLPHKNDPVQNINAAEVEKPRCRSMSTHLREEKARIPDYLDVGSEENRGIRENSKIVDLGIEKDGVGMD